MEVREKLNGNNRLGMGVAVAVVIVGIGVLAVRFSGGRENGLAAPSSSAYYTDDDGKTFFKDDINRLAPFDHNGKQAYRADVFRGSDGKEFVGLIYRYTDAGRREMQAYLPNSGKDSDGSTRQSIEQRGMEVRRPGGNEKSWTLNDEMTTQRLQAATRDATGKPATLVTP